MCRVRSVSCETTNIMWNVQQANRHLFLGKANRHLCNVARVIEEEHNTFLYIYDIFLDIEYIQTCVKAIRRMPFVLQ
jgi:hypothetical protein